MIAAPARIPASSGRRRLVRIHEARTKGILLEQSAQDLRSAGVYKVVLLREGPGNPRDRHYYSADAIRNAPPIFNGKPAFVDHPDMIEEEVQPERSVKDVVGWYENVAAAKEAGSGKWLLTAELWTIPGQSVQWCRDLLDAALLKRERDPVADDLIGLSINATGITVPKDVGSEEWHEVQEFVEAKSTDLVTQAGAGGRVVALKEAMRKRLLSRVQEGLMSAVQVKGAIDTLRDRFNVAGDPVLRSVVDELGKVYMDLTHEEAERSDTSMGRAAETERGRASEDERGGRASEDERGGRASERGMSATEMEARVRSMEREMAEMRGGRAAEDERGRASERGRAAEDERGRAGERGRASEDERGGRAAERGRASEDERGGRASERGRASEDERGGRAAEAYMGEMGQGEDEDVAPAGGGPTAGPSFADWARSEMGELPGKGDDDGNGDKNGDGNGKGAKADDGEAEDGQLGLDDHIKGLSARLKQIEDEIAGAKQAGGRAFKGAEREAYMGERRESSAPAAQPSGAGRGNYNYGNVAPYDFGNVTRAAEAEDEDERARAAEARAAEAKGGEDEEEDEEEGAGRASERGGRRRASEDAISHSRLPGVTEEGERRAAEARRRAAEDEDLPPQLQPRAREARAIRRELVRLKTLREERARRRALSIPSTLREAAARENYHMLAAARPSYQDLVVELAKARTSLQAYRERDENAEILREVDAPESSWKFLTHQMTGLPYKEKRALAESYCAPLRVREFAVERFGQGPGGAASRVGRVDGAELAAFLVGQGVPMEGRH